MFSSSSWIVRNRNILIVTIFLVVEQCYKLRQKWKEGLLQNEFKNLQERQSLQNKKFTFE